MTKLIELWLGSRLWALIVKEAREILRNAHLIFLLLVPPVIELLVLGAALDPQVRNLSVGFVDYAQSQESRDLTAAITECGIFPASTHFPDQQALGRQLEQGKVDVGVVIPPRFTEDLDRDCIASTQECKHVHAQATREKEHSRQGLWAAMLSFRQLVACTQHAITKQTPKNQNISHESP